MTRSFVCAIIGACCIVGCDAPRVTLDAQGVSVAPGPCGRGLVVVESDYQSSNVALLGFDGSVLSTSLISSRTESSGFGVALSGDVVAPSSPQTGRTIALIDRYPAGVLRFVELASARLVSELSVATGFKSNPHDYLQLSDSKAYVSRYEANPTPGAQPLDAGADVLIVDPSVPAITGRIDLSSALAGEPARFSAHPSQLLRVGERVFVSLTAYANDYSTSVSSRLLELDTSTNTIASTLVLDGLHGCDSLALSPDRQQLAISCTGDRWHDTPPELDGSGLALIDITDTPRLERSFAASEFGRNVLGFGLDYASQTAIIFGTLGYFDDAGSADLLLRFDTQSGLFDELLRSDGVPFTLGAVRCAPGCGACFVSDAQREGGSVLRFPLDANGVSTAPTPIRVETQIGLPPRYLSVF